MATVRLFLWKYRPNRFGNYPVYIRVTQFRKPITLSLDIDVPEQSWNGHGVNTSVKGHQRINNYLSIKYTQVQEAVLKARETNTYITKEILHEVLKGKPPVDYYSYAEKYNSKDNFYTNKDRASKLNILKEFAGSKLLFTDIDYNFLKRYEAYLVKRGNQRNTIGSHMKKIRTLIRAAVSDNILKEDQNPFRKYKIRSEKVVSKNPLTREELQLFRNAKTIPGTWAYHAQNTFLFSFNNYGMRISDVLQIKSNRIKDGRLIYDSSKTEDPFSIELTEESKAIIKKYDKNITGYIFPLLKGNRQIEKEIDSASALLRKGLKAVCKIAGIKKHVTNHTARHTVAQLAMEADAPQLLIQELFGHESIKTTQIYLHGFGKKRLDQLNKKITAVA